MADIVTVDYLLDLFTKLREDGKGDMQIKCLDNPLHEDEIGINYITNQVQFRGLIYNLPITDRVKKFCDDIDKARKEFYGSGGSV